MIRLKSDTLEAWVHPTGATLVGLWLRGRPRSLVLGFAGASGYARIPIYAGAIVGPVANRIAKGQLTIGNDPWQMQTNDGPHALHSADQGLHARHWTIRSKSRHQVTLTCDLPDGDAGLPGNRVIEARYILQDEGGLDVHMSAISDRDTVMNLAHHPYWNLDGRETVSRHTLQIHAYQYLPTDYDFRQFTALPVDRTLDANLCLARARRVTPALAAELVGSTGVHLTIETTEPGLQVYNGSGLPDIRVPMHPGQRLGPCAGIALEPQSWPDAPNNPEFPSISLPGGQMYRQHTRYRVFAAT
jgi:aldose 1-epimerase